MWPRFNIFALPVDAPQFVREVLNNLPLCEQGGCLCITNLLRGAAFSLFYLELESNSPNYPLYLGIAVNMERMILGKFICFLFSFLDFV